MSAGSNTRACFRECVGKTIKGILFDALPAARPDLANNNKTFIFEDGTGLTFASNGSFWLENAQNVQCAIDNRRAELEKARNEIAEVISLADGRRSYQLDVGAE